MQCAGWQKFHPIISGASIITAQQRKLHATHRSSAKCPLEVCSVPKRGGDAMVSSDKETATSTDFSELNKAPYQISGVKKIAKFSTPKIGFCNTSIVHNTPGHSNLVHEVAQRRATL